MNEISLGMLTLERTDEHVVLHGLGALDESWAALRAKLDPGPWPALVEHIEKHEGQIGAYHCAPPPQSTTRWTPYWIVRVEYPDHPVEGEGPTLDDAATSVLAQLRVNPCGTCSWAQTCPDGCHS